LSVAEKYVEAFGKLAKEGTAVVVPGNMGDIASMIAGSLAVYGKVTEGQRRTLENRGYEDEKSSSNALTQESSHNKTDEVARSVLQGFEETRKKR